MSESGVTKVTLTNRSFTDEFGIPDFSSGWWFTDGEAVEPMSRVSSRAHVRLNAPRLLWDAACAVVAFLVAGMVQFGFGIGPIPRSFVLLASLAPFAWIAVFWNVGLYRRDAATPWDEFRRVVKGTTVAAATVVLAGVWLDQGDLRATLVVAWLTALVLELMMTPLWRRRFSRLRRSQVLSYKTLIVGTNDEAERLAHSLAIPASGFEPLGYVTSSRPRGSANGWHILGHIDDLAGTIRRHGADCLVVAATDVSRDDVVRLASVARRENVEVRISVKLPEVLTNRVSLEATGDVAALSIRPVWLSAGKMLVKRAFDVVAASALLLVTLPIMAAVAAAVRLTSSGPVLFTQERVTKGGALFRIYKFRTMYHKAVSDTDAARIDSTSLYFKMKDDPRLTRVGRLLRRYSLDELPQLWNVIRGDISLVGPRPLWSAQVDATSEAFRSRHEVRAGLTGWWQVNGRSGVDPEEAMRMDLFYIENWSLTLDLYILLKTIPTVLRSTAY